MGLNKRRIAYHAARGNLNLLDKLVGNCFFQEFASACENGAPEFSQAYDQRHLMHEYLAQKYLDESPIDYMEFGVFKGESITNWARMNKHAQSRFFGFDTFEGLPEDWGKIKKGTFAVDGKAPSIDDGRVSFYKGVFQETLRPFLRDFEQKNRLVIHLDADLYSATLFVLTMLDDLIRPGTLVFFDQFADVQHEFLAFRDYTRSYLRKYKLVCRTEGLGRLAVEMA